MKISVVSPSSRMNGLDIVRESLNKQSFSDFEWLVCSPLIYKLMGYPNCTLYGDPRRRENDFYNLNKAWNLLINRANGELIVFIVDYTEFAEDTLEKLWQHYVDNPITCYSGIGNQYDGDKLVWFDPRIEGKKQHFIAPEDMEFRLASIPKRAIQAVGGMDEEYDKVVACSEKELCLRINSLGYLFLIDETINYKFYKHEDHGEKWDELYIKGRELLNHHWNEILLGNRLRLNYVAR